MSDASGIPEPTRRVGEPTADPASPAEPRPSAGAGEAVPAASEASAGLREPALDTAMIAADVVSHAGTAAASPEVAPVAAESGLPGAHRGGFARLPTAPVELTSQPGSAWTDEATEPAVLWAPREPVPARRGLAAWALGSSIVGLVVSFFVGWGFPVGLVGVVAAIMALRRPVESRGVAVWALVLGILSVVYSAGWLLFAARSASLFG